MDLIKLSQQEQVVPFLRRVSTDWDFVKGQLVGLEPDDKLFLVSWCKKAEQVLQGSLLGLDYEDRLLRLESDKDRLHLQVACLTDQIEAQTAKVGDLERVLDDKRGLLETTEDSLQRELLTRSTLETQKLELLTEISSLRLRQASLERENLELKDRYGLWGKPPIAAGVSSPVLTSPNANSNGTAATLSRIRLDSTGSESGANATANLNLALARSRPRTPPANAFRRVDQHSAFGTLPRRTPSNQGQPQLSIFNGYGQGQFQGHNVNVEQLLQQQQQYNGHGGGSGGRGASLSSGNLNAHSVSNHNHGTTAKIAPMSFGVNNYNYGQGHGGGGFGCGAPPAGVGGGGSYKLQLNPATGAYNVCTNTGGGGDGGMAYSYGHGGYASPPAATSMAPPTQLIGGGGGGSVDGNRSTSTPNLAAIERDGWQRRNSGPSFISTKIVKSPPPAVLSAPLATQHKSRSSGFLKLFGKLRRSNSGGLDKDSGTGGAVIAPSDRDGNSAFVRGGIARSTAAPRLGWSSSMQAPELVRKPPPQPHGPVTSWDSDAVIVWFNWLGLGAYSGDVGRWVKSGQQLLDAGPHEVEKELGVKNPMHRKKLVLALQALRPRSSSGGVNEEDPDPGGKLDYHWVIRWLDDIGLPQYKEPFAEARVDGRVLHALTADDLLQLKVTSLLHHTSIKRAIQLLRIHKFQPNCLCRRSEAIATLNGSGHGPKHVATWTNHRVMEWLRAIDLAEYAPNMRGSGVHGALIVFEPCFNAELLSTLLAIPANKTLLRRHLSLQVNELVGKRLVQEKRAVELAPEFVPMSPTLRVKIKPTKHKVFGLRRKRWNSGVGEELLCPLELNSYPYPFDVEAEAGSTPTSEGSPDSPMANGNSNRDTDKISNI